MPARDNPIVSELWRGEGVESQHRGAWVAVDTSGNVVDSRGDPTQLVYARSSTKSIQAMALFESGAADKFALTDSEMAVAISSHNGEAIHVAAVRSILSKAGLSEQDLQCGPEPPMGGYPSDAGPARITNNCSGKHAGFLAAAVAFGDDPSHYLQPDSQVQRSVHAAILAITGADKSQVSTAVDGCSAPTFRLPLNALATGMAQIANPDGLPERYRTAAQTMVAAARSCPELVAGTAKARFDTDIIAATDGRIFAKGGAEGLQTLGIAGAEIGFAAKIDDGSPRSLHRLTIAVLERLGHLDETEVERLASWLNPVRRNYDNLDIGRHTICEGVLPVQ